MVLEKDGKKILVTPLSRQDLEILQIGNIVYLSGELTTCRDVAHRRLVEMGTPLPVEVRGHAILHAGPIVRPLEDGQFQMVSIGPTTSSRMERFEKEFIARTGVRVIVGKGGMGAETAWACQKFGCIHCVFPAGNAVLAATKVREILDIQWTELGMPETLWKCAVEEFGPLIVSIDASGHNLFENRKPIYEQRRQEALDEIVRQVAFIQ